MKLKANFSYNPTNKKNKIKINDTASNYPFKGRKFDIFG